MIVEQTAHAFIDLAQSPSSLDPMEIDARLKKYNQAIQQHVLNQPIDPIYVQALSNLGQERDGVLIHASIKTPELALSAQEAAPDPTIADPSKLIVPFPTTGEMNN